MKNIKSDEEILLEFAEQLSSSQINLDGDIVEMVNNNFWELLLKTDDIKF